MDDRRLEEGRVDAGGAATGVSAYAFVSPLMIEADAAFRRDLPQLLEDRPGEWVAYHGPERIGFAPTKDEMYRRCRERGLGEDEFLVSCVEPGEDLMFGPGAILDAFSGDQG